MNQQQKKKICEKINSAKYAKLIAIDEFNKGSDKFAISELKKELTKNSSFLLLIISK